MRRARITERAPGGGAPSPRFERMAAFLLAAPPDPDTTPYLLHALILQASEEQRWAEARGLAVRLIEEFPSHPAAPTALTKIGTAATRASQWPVSRDVYRLLADRYPASEAGQHARIGLAESLLRMGAPSDARDHLQAALDSAPGARAEARALALLAEVHDALGDRTRALQAYGRLAREHPAVHRSPETLLKHARLLEAEGDGERARPLLETLIRSADSRVASEASYHLAENLGGRGQHWPAVELYMTAAYLAPGSAWEGRALLGAARSLTALRQTDQALILYRKLLSGDMRHGRPEAGGSQHQAMETFEAAYLLADILRDEGRHKDALGWYLTAVSLAPEPGARHRALLGAARSHMAMNQREPAVTLYQMLLTVTPAESDITREAREAVEAEGAGAAPPKPGARPASPR